MQAVLRTARRLRDVSRNLLVHVHDDGPEALEAWTALDKALQALDGFSERIAQENAAEDAEVFRQQGESHARELSDKLHGKGD